MLGRRRVLMAVGVLLAPLASIALAAPPYAHAGSASSRAARCTITGTPHRDRLVGTHGRDVICGLGGNDVLIGRGGNDVLEGGAGDDVLKGGAGDDLLKGGAGDDDLSGDAGNDEVSGGVGPDLELGGDGRDRVLGGRGNDDLNGGPRPDTIDGGPGTNWCTVDASDDADQCVYDRAPAVADEVQLSTDTVDVTDGDQSVTLRIHVTDDTGTRAVVVDSSEGTPWYPRRKGADLVSGDVRDGWWEVTITFPQWVRPGTYVPTVRTYDRVERVGTYAFPDSSVTVLDTTPDVDLPDLTMVSPLPTDTFDSRGDGVSVPLKVHLTDAQSGVDPNHGFFLLWSPSPDRSLRVGFAGSLHLASGTVNDGIWKGSVYIPDGQPGGDWNYEIFVSDQANHGTEYGADYWGPGLYEEPGRYSFRDNRQIPDGMGSVHIDGAALDTEAPTASDLSMTPTSVDTLSSAANVHLSVDVDDTGGAGLLGVSALLRSADPTVDMPWIIGGLSSPDGSDGPGTWSGDLNLPQGLPPGTYYVQIMVFDNADNESDYIGTDYPGAWFGQRFDTSTAVTVVDSSGP